MQELAWRKEEKLKEKTVAVQHIIFTTTIMRE